MSKSSNVLDIVTNPPRAVVRIDGKPYQLRGLNDFAASQFKTLERISPRIGMLADGKPELTAAESSELDALLEEACAIALQAPPAVLKKLRPLHRMAVLRQFYEAIEPDMEKYRRMMLTSIQR